VYTHACTPIETSKMSRSDADFRVRVVCSLLLLAG
jgi:hypothetical protein